jgi:hypothetical protein
MDLEFALKLSLEDQKNHNQEDPQIFFDDWLEVKPIGQALIEDMLERSRICTEAVSD